MADGWAPKAGEAFYAFNDIHAVMAFAASGRIAEAEQLIADRETYLAEDRPGVTNQTVTARVGLPVCGALVGFVRGEHDKVVDLLYPVRHHLESRRGSARPMTARPALTSTT